MIGAIIGDIVGSIYEFNNHRSKEFEFFGEECFLTDDSIMTLAVMEIMSKRLYKDENAIIDTFKKWGRAYPNRGYGGHFGYWLQSDDRKSYGSYGNGAAMRISPVGYFANSEKEVREAAHNITIVTHDHPEGMKGAEVVAMCIYYAKIGKSKEFIEEYVATSYNIMLDYEYLKRYYSFNETSQNTVPQAIYCFLISKDYEDAIRTAISIGGDSDTIAAITGGIAEAYYKHIPDEILNGVLRFVPEDSNGCSPMSLIVDYLSERLSVFTSCEEISEDTMILSKEVVGEDKSEVGFSFSKSKDVLIDYVLDSLDCESDLFMEVQKNRENDIEGLNKIFDNVDKGTSIKVKYRLYHNPDEAVRNISRYISEDGTSLYTEIFLNNYTITK